MCSSAGALKLEDTVFGRLYLSSWLLTSPPPRERSAIQTLYFPATPFHEPSSSRQKAGNVESISQEEEMTKQKSPKKTERAYPDPILPVTTAVKLLALDGVHSIATTWGR